MQREIVLAVVVYAVLIMAIGFGCYAAYSYAPKLTLIVGGFCIGKALCYIVFSLKPSRTGDNAMSFNQVMFLAFAVALLIVAVLLNIDTRRAMLQCELSHSTEVCEHTIR